MYTYLPDTEVKKELKKIEIIADTREQENSHILKYANKNGVPIVNRKLYVGDYSAQIGNHSLEQTVVVERKHNLDEVAGNLTEGRERFEREFIRAKAYGIKVFLVIENASWEDAYCGNYHSKLSPKSLIASLLAWQMRFNVTIIFCKQETTPSLIHGIMYYAAREVLKYGE